MLPADFPEAHGSNRAGCPLQRVERTTLQQISRGAPARARRYSWKEGQFTENTHRCRSLLTAMCCEHNHLPQQQPQAQSERGKKNQTNLQEESIKQDYLSIINTVHENLCKRVLYSSAFFPLVRKKFQHMLNQVSKISFQFRQHHLSLTKNGGTCS